MKNDLKKELEDLTRIYTHNHEECLEKLNKAKELYDASRRKIEFEIYHVREWVNNNEKKKYQKYFYKIDGYSVNIEEKKVRVIRHTFRKIRKLLNKASKMTVTVKEIFSNTEGYFTKYHMDVCEMLKESLDNWYDAILNLISEKNNLEQLDKDYSKERTKLEKKITIYERKSDSVENKTISTYPTKNDTKEKPSYLDSQLIIKNITKPKSYTEHSDITVDTKTTVVSNSKCDTISHLGQIELYKELKSLAKLAENLEHEIPNSIINEKKIPENFIIYKKTYDEIKSVLDENCVPIEMLNLFVNLLSPSTLMKNAQIDLENNIRPLILSLLDRTEKNLAFTENEIIDLIDKLIKFTFLTPPDEIPVLIESEVFRPIFALDIENNSKLDKSYLMNIETIIKAFVVATQKNIYHLNKADRQIIESNTYYNRIDNDLVILEYFEKYHIEINSLSTIIMMVDKIQDKHIKSLFSKRIIGLQISPKSTINR